MDTKTERVYGYCRISTSHQKIDRQIENILRSYPNAYIVREVFTGTQITGRREWNKLYALVNEEVKRVKVTIVFDEVSRMSRNAEEGITLYEELMNAGVNLVFLKESHINTATYKNALEQKFNIDTQADHDTNELVKAITDALNRYMMALARNQIRLAFENAEAEVNFLHMRTSEGIRQAKLDGKQIGAVMGKKLVTKKAIECKKIIQSKNVSFGGVLSDEECIKLTGVSRNSFYKYKKELRTELNV